MKTLQHKIKHAPNAPGCYIYRDKNAKILYIGKAVNLRKRVSSYFRSTERLDPKIAILVDQIQDVEFLTTENELEALILEANLIKKYKPKYNRMMKDDKNYAWLMVTKAEDFPRIEFVRSQKIKNADYFGPYVNLKTIKRALKGLRKIFPYRSCKRTMYFKKDKKGKITFYSSNKKPCLYYSMNLCTAPCTGNVSKASYRKNINNIKRFFRSMKFKIIRDLEKQMKEASSSQKYEEAANIRNKLEDLAWLSQRIKIEKDMDEIIWKKQKEKTRLKAVKSLVKRLRIHTKGKKLKYKKGFRIECYDISNISGKSATGSMVVFTDGKPDKKNYRKFKIKTQEEPDDYLMLKEVFERRFKKTDRKYDKSFKNFPDLIIVDGGKGQLSSVLKILYEKKFKIPAIGLAKKEEEIFKFKGGKFKKIKLKRGSDESFLIQRIRDEAHRFAIKYHKVLRSKKQIKSVLDDIPGVGEIIRKKLLKAFGSAEGIRKASFEELQSVIKNKKTAENIKKLL